MGDMGMTTPSLSFWEGRRVLVTGHTGFKGSWLSCWLNQLKAEIYGYSLAPDADPNLYECLALSYAGEKLGDLRDQDVFCHSLFKVILAPCSCPSVALVAKLDRNLASPK